MELYLIGGAIFCVPIVYTVFGDCLRTHREMYLGKQIGGQWVTVKEKVTNWNAHRIKVEITQSPYDKVTGIFIEQHTWSAESSRKACYEALQAIVQTTYSKR